MNLEGDDKVEEHGHVDESENNSFLQWDEEEQTGTRENPVFAHGVPYPAAWMFAQLTLWSMEINWMGWW